MALTRAICAAAIFFFCALATPGADSAQARQRVLYVSSYHPAFPSFFPQVEGIRDGLVSTGRAASEIVLDFEYMDTKRFTPEMQVPHFLANLKRKLAILDPYDVVIAADDNAFEMAVANQATLFRDSPVVFLGVNDRDAAVRQNSNPRVTGVVENISLDATLGLIERLYPLSKRIVAISDDTPVGRIAREHAFSLAAGLRNHELEILSLEDLSYDELYQRLGALPDSVPVLLLTAYRDRQGAIGEFLDVLARIKAVFNGGIFVNQRHGIGHGVLGGELVDHRRQGMAAGELVARILDGVPVSSLAVIEKSPNTMTVDFEEAKRLGFDERDFPAATEFANRPVSYLSQHREVILAAVAVALGQALVILLLFRSGRRRRGAEKAAVQARTEAEIANKAKTEFLANMSHELRTPLNSVIGFADVMIADRVGAIKPEKRAEYLSDIRESGQHLLDLLNNILDVAKIEMGKLQITDQEIDVAQVLKLCQRLVAERAASNNTRIEISLPQELPHLRADSTRLKQSVLNLLSNAVKFSDGGGTIRVTARVEDDGAMAISVRDDGPGIPSDEIEWVLAPFNRGRSSAVAVKDGSGLGLPLTASLMQSHGGHLKIESEVRVGTTATLIFPPDRVIAARPVRARAVNA